MRPHPLFAKRFDRMVNDLDNVDLLVTTETYDGRFGLLFPSIRDRWRRWTSNHANSVLVSSFLVDDSGHRINSMAAIDKGVWVGLHEKIDLAPFGEAALKAGVERKPLQLSENINVGIMICNEALLRHPSHQLVDTGANLLVATVNDVSFGSSLIVFSHLAQARLRAIEVGRDIVWASNAGPSGVIDRWGHFSRVTPFRQPVAIRAVAEIHNIVTPLQSIRWVPLAFCLLVLLVMVRKTYWYNVSNSKPHTVFPLSSSGSWRGFALGVTGVALSVVVIATSAALVETQSGDPRRSSLAVQETLQGTILVADQDPYARFRNMPSADLRAIAYFLEYFGFDAPIETLLAETKNATSLQQIATLLEQYIGMPTRILTVGPEELPRVAALTRLTDGRLVVVNQPNINGTVSLFDSATGQTTVFPMKAFMGLGISNFLIPSQP